MDKFREDFKKEFEFIDWFNSLSLKEQKECLSQSDIVEGDNDQSVLNLSKEELEEWMAKYNLHDASEWIERFKSQ